MTKPKKDKPVKIDYSIQTIGGRECIILQTGPDTHQIDVGAIASWGVLLGLTDEAEILKAIVQDARDPTVDVDWEGLYAALNDNLVDTSKAGVPAEFVEDILDPDVDSPIPRSKNVDRLKNARDKAKADLWTNSTDQLDAAALTVLVDSIDSDKVSANRVEFIDGLAPVFESMPSLPADWNALPEVS